MESETRYTYVGAALLVLVAAIALSLIWLKQSGPRGRAAIYTINFERLPLDGLQVGGDVEMRGIKVGRVEDYTISSTNINRVVVTIRVDRRTPVSQNTVATISRNYVTGIARISLVTSGLPGAPLGGAPSGEPHPIIPEGYSELEEIRVTLKGLAEQAAQAMASINQTLGPANRQAMHDAFDSIGYLADGLQQRLEKLDGAITSFNDGAARLGHAAGRVANATEDWGDQLAPALAQARQSMEQISAAVKAIERQSASLATRLETTAASVDDQLTIGVAELRATMGGMARTLERLEDPRTAIFGPAESQLGPGEKLQ